MSEENLEQELDKYKSNIDPENKLTLEWEKDLIFTARTNRGYEFDFDAKVEWGCMPTEGLLASIAGCMAIDMVMFLTKMRCEIASYKMQITGTRNPTPPQYYTGVNLHLIISGLNITEKKMERAVNLSKDKYCSVYHTLRPDLEHTVTWEITEETPKPKED
ncbi:OsmC family protein [Nitrospirota bacterium]